MPSNKNLEAVKNLTEKLNKANAIYFTDYLGLDVVSITKLRKEFVSNDVEFTIAKNTLIKLAAKDVGMEGLDDFLNKLDLGDPDPTNHRTGFQDGDDILEWFRNDKPDDWRQRD